MRVVILALCLSAVSCAALLAPKRYQDAMVESSLAKQSGDHAGVERAVTEALRWESGDEYAWRTLAWAQGRQGKWTQSLTNAKENVRRNGATGWSLAQLAESALGAGDFALARKALADAAILPREQLDGSGAPLRDCYRRLREAVGDRVYDLRFEVDLRQGGPKEKPVWLLMPQMQSDRQSFTFTVRGVVSYQVRHVGIRDYVEVVQSPGQPFTIEGKLILKGFSLGTRLDQVQAGEPVQRLTGYLKRFQNRSWWDPTLAEVQAIARALKGRSDVETVQNVLDWFKANIQYDATIQDDPALGQLGTILKLRRGGCHHNSGLFVTLCRAAGVPAVVAHGNALPTNDQLFDVIRSQGHGWAEVYLPPLGWVPVEPMDVMSLRTFTANRAYMSVGASNRPPDNHHFSGTILFQGKSYRVVSIQGAERMTGRLVETRLPD